MRNIGSAFTPSRQDVDEEGVIIRENISFITTSAEKYQKAYSFKLYIKTASKFRISWLIITDSTYICDISLCLNEDFSCLKSEKINNIIQGIYFGYLQAGDHYFDVYGRCCGKKESKITYSRVEYFGI